jgi:Cdc6-like AAA superfamily ATPase
MERHTMIARDEYYEDILRRITSVEAKVVSLYICGKPGTGKTYTVDQVLQQVRRRKNLNRRFTQIVEINGMEVSNSADIWKLFQKYIGLKRGKSPQRVLFNYLETIEKPVLIIIDEFENLINQCNSELITEIFALPYMYEKVKMVYISNLVDLPDMFMPQLKKRACEPEIILFPPYSRSELLEIIKDLYGEMSDSIALEVCAAQVERIGDARRALGICKNSMKNGKISLSSTMKTTTNWHSPLKVLSDLPYLNKKAVVLCKKLCESKLNTTQMHSAYKSLCSKEGGEGLPLKEFVDMIQNLSEVGVVKLEGQAKNILKMFPKVSVSWEELEKAFKDLPELLDLANLQTHDSWKFNL